MPTDQTLGTGHYQVKVIVRIRNALVNIKSEKVLSNQSFSLHIPNYLA